MLHKNSKIFLIAALGTLSLAGCGKNSDEEIEMAAFSSSISDFTSYINDANEKINSLDTTQSDSKLELLNILDDMDSEFSKLTEIDVPTQYASVKTFAEGASKNMSSAVSYYHLAYDTDIYDENDADAAYEHYTRAMLEIECIGYVLSGDEIPEDLLENAGIHVTVYEGSNDEKILDKWLSDDEETETATTVE
jgi:hypothetical protein